MAVETKRLVEPRDVPRLAERLHGALQAQQADIPLVAARYLSETARKRLKEAELSYVDATGNIYIHSERPALFIGDRGANHDPWRGPGRPRSTLNGAPAAQVVRALIDTRGPWKMRSLITASEAATGSVYRVVDFLSSEALVTRDDGLIHVPDWSQILRRWSRDYEFLHTNTVTRWIAPRGLDHALEKLRNSSYEGYAATGTIAASTWAEYAPTRSAMLFTQGVVETAKLMGLRETDSGANVLLASPAFPALMRGASNRPDGIRVVAPAQAAVDLMTGPGRSPSEAEELLEWMKGHEDDWRNLQ
ncbi:hypothetical protein DTO57_13680 [Microbacterium sorbitolivorans]|uniref:Uncharacterized protein n=1 Tax=Microbacterium sorbitolivorans TaxID=1867410 RepID=A0A367XVW5_9MICO|nr:hypothetical protein DTO57_13680 [Microbacterium sorbitolivorans]